MELLLKTLISIQLKFLYTNFLSYINLFEQRHKPTVYY